MTIKFTVKHTSIVEKELEVPGYYASDDRTYLLTEIDHVCITGYGISRWPNTCLGQEELARMNPIPYEDFRHAYEKQMAFISGLLESNRPQELNITAENIALQYGITNIQEDHD